MANSRFETKPITGQTPAKPADREALIKDQNGYTHPNLHRRIDPQEPPKESDELLPRDYSIGIYGLNSYRTTTFNYHDDASYEASDDSEIP